MDTSKPKIVMVDDDAFFLDMTKRRLGSLGNWDILIFADIEEALALLRREPVDVVLADIRMPQMNGIEFLVQARPLCPEAIQMLMTSFSDHKAAVEAIHRLPELYFFFDKGRDWHELAIILRNALEKKKLSLRLQQRIKELEVIQDDLLRQKKQAVIGELIQGTCHNINTPLGVILGHVETMRWGIQSLQNKHGISLATLLEPLGQIEEATHRIQDITNNLVNKSRMDQSPKLQEVSLNDLVEREVKFLQADSFLRNRVDVTLEFFPALPKLSINYGDFSQILGNLIRNALDAVFKHPQPKLFLKTWATETSVGLEVHDNGPGIPEELRQRIFDPFFTTKKRKDDLYPTTASQQQGGEEPQGTGLGLYSVKRLLEPYSGVVEVETSPLGGACFRIILPRPPATLSSM